MSKNRYRCVGMIVALAGLAAGAVQAQEPSAEREPQRDQVRKRVIVREHDGDGRHPRVMVLDGQRGRGYLGVDLVNLTPELREHFGAPEDAGVMVSKVMADSPAAQAGVAVGDIIASIDGEEVASNRDVVQQVRPKNKGDRVTLEVYRNRKPTTLRVEVGERSREVVDVAPMMEWHGGGPERREFHFRMDPEALERISEIESERVLEGMDIEKIVEAALHEAERRPAELEQRLAEMEKRLAELQKRLAELQKKN